ncbi:MAG: hypothetical protein ACYCWE_02640 [Eubacteriales bacterium]
MAGKYEPWTNERVDRILKGRFLTRISQVGVGREKVKFHCEICGKDFDTLPHNLENGTGCPFCYKTNKAGKRRKPKWSIKEIRQYALDNGYTILSKKYENNKELMLFKDNSTGKEIEMTFRSLQARIKGLEIKEKINQLREETEEDEEDD